MVSQRFEDQKLIYSGQLLSDSTVLKDVLRVYEGQENHTVHLVCSPSKESLKSMAAQSSKKPTPTPSSPPADSKLKLTFYDLFYRLLEEYAGVTVFCLHSVASKLIWFVEQHSSVGT